MTAVYNNCTFHDNVGPSWVSLTFPSAVTSIYLPFRLSFKVSFAWQIRAGIILQYKQHQRVPELRTGGTAFPLFKQLVFYTSKKDRLLAFSVWCGGGIQITGCLLLLARNRQGTMGPRSFVLHLIS